jgi:hypothetical protein
MTLTAQFPDEQVDGAFARQEDAFTSWVKADGSSGFPAVAGRYHLYVSLACPWAHRTIIVRSLKKLEHAIGMSIVDPLRDERGWAFTEANGPDPINGFTFLSQAYTETDPAYRGRVTVPVLWDKETRSIVSNNDDHIMRMLETEFDAVAGSRNVDFYPEAHRSEIDALNAEIYNGVRRVQRTRPARGTLSPPPVPVRYDAGRNRLAPVRHADPVRCGLRRAFQVQSPPDRRLPESLGLSARFVPIPRRRRNGKLRPHQTALLHDA